MSVYMCHICNTCVVVYEYYMCFRHVIHMYEAEFALHLYSYTYITYGAYTYITCGAYTYITCVHVKRIRDMEYMWSFKVWNTSKCKYSKFIH